jgi:hypothetical protein
MKEASVLSTEPAPFQLEVDKRGMIKKQQLRQKVTIWLVSQGQRNVYCYSLGMYFQFEAALENF